jgi:hypothetical protein
MPSSVLGDDNKHIAALDTGSVALAAIQVLRQQPKANFLPQYQIRFIEKHESELIASNPNKA